MSTSIDPAGIINFQEYDNAGRGVRSIANYQTGAAAAADDANVTTETTYNPDGEVATLTAKNPDTGDQTTYYEYGVVEFDDSDPPLLIIATNDLLRATIYPDSADGDDQVKYTYNRQGQTTGVTDQNGSIHAFTFDLLGRPLTDIVSTVGSDVDAGVERIDRAYEVRGMVNLVTSYADTTTGTKVNEVTLLYNDFAQLISDEQDHSGAGGSQPTVQYGYVGGTGNTTRRTSVTYPDTKVLDYDYAGTDNTKLSRVGKLTFDSDVVVDYTYFGLGGVAKTNYPEAGASNTMATGSSYSGFDRFGRVTDLPWKKTDPGDLARLKYGYDQASNRTYREDVRAENQLPTRVDLDELYGYDDLQRLTSANRGELVDAQDRITSPSLAQTWNLDPTGNWNGFSSIDQGTPLNGLVQNRTANAANEVDIISATVGDVWKQPVHDRNGNMTTMPKPSALTDGYNASYDAWNRLVSISETGGATVATYEYDGLNRRTFKTVSGTTTHFYYSDEWQVLEERLDAASTANERFVWGLRYVDDLVLRDHATLVRLYALQDANWNVVALIDSAGAVKQRFVYDPYGTSTALNPDFSAPYSGTDYAWEYRFTGRRLEIETGLYYYRNRYYHSDLGRFISSDPIGYRGGMSLYAYVGARPLDLFDPFGLAPQAADAKPSTAEPKPTYEQVDSGAGHQGTIITSIQDVDFNKQKLTDAIILQYSGTKCAECCWVQFKWRSVSVDRGAGLAAARSKAKDIWGKYNLTEDPKTPVWRPDSSKKTDPCYVRSGGIGRRSKDAIMMIDRPGSGKLWVMKANILITDKSIKSVRVEIHFNAYFVCAKKSIHKVEWKVTETYVKGKGWSGPKTALIKQGKGTPNAEQLKILKTLIPKQKILP